MESEGDGFLTAAGFKAVASTERLLGLLLKLTLVYLLFLFSALGLILDTQIIGVVTVISIS